MRASGFTRHMATEESAEIFVMRADGSNLRKLTEYQWEDSTPAWKPQARR